MSVEELEDKIKKIEEKMMRFQSKSSSKLDKKTISYIVIAVVIVIALYFFGNKIEFKKLGLTIVIILVVVIGVLRYYKGSFAAILK